MPRPKLVVFDINDTLIEDNSWVQLNTALGMTEEEDRVLWRLNKDGILTNDMWVSIVNAIYRQRGVPTIGKIKESILNHSYIEGAKECVKTLQEAGVKIALLSGSVDLFVRQIADELGIEIYRASSSLYFNADGTLAKMTYLDEEEVAKVYDFVAICQEAGVEFDDAICVGDGANERELFKLARGITFEGSRVADVAWKVVPSIKEVSQVLLAG